MSESASLGSLTARSRRRQRRPYARESIDLFLCLADTSLRSVTSLLRTDTDALSAAALRHTALVYDSVHVHRLAADMVTSDYTNESFVDAIKSASSRWDLQDDTKRDAWLLETNAVLKGVC